MLGHSSSVPRIGAVALQLASVLLLIAGDTATNVTELPHSVTGPDPSSPCSEGSYCTRLLQCPDVDRMAIVDYLSRPAVLRPPSERRWESARWRRCQLEDGSISGICCTPGTAGNDNMVHLETDSLAEVVSEEVLQKAQATGLREASRFREKPDGDALPADLVWQGLQDVLTLQALRRMTNGTGNLQDIRRPKRCLVGPPCKKTHSRYRRYDGQCNNLEPGCSLWGAVGYPVERVLPPAYGDGVWAPRAVSTTGRYLPTARKLSSTLFVDLHHPHPQYNVLLMQFGQFLAHDFSRNKALDGSAKCCTEDGSARLQNASVGCMPIPVLKGDDFYAQYGVKCLHFVRTAVAPMSHCGAQGYARQLSSTSHFIDGSPIYGASSREADELRAHEGGRLKSLHHRRHHNELPPLDRREGSCEKRAEMCFKTGDVRSNQLLSLVAVHTLFLREHNRIARHLERINPHWSDRTIFQEARRIVIAQLQHIVYAEYLPKIVGPQFASIYKLHSGGAGDYTEHYRHDVNPSVSSEFTVAAFRFGHSTVPSKFELKDGPVETWQTFLDPSRFREHTFYDELFHAIQHQPMQSVDDMFTTSLTHFLDVKPGNPYGTDLIAINIQRGRDHALRPYNDYLRLGGKSGVGSFEEFGPGLGSKLASLYAAVEDIDLYVGGILEQPVADGVVGETFAELISDQFAKFRHGDRYFYSNGPATNPGHFTLPQLRELQRITMASLICANAGDTHRMEVVPDAFALPHDGNRPVACSSPNIPHLNLDWWRD
ncbi:chorion peroxidase-like [Anopheles bellator]|uniref:chorion peroxidase-like n=1 Tax=Anopheles bellator TaxID=139047 RepID=UPI0026491BBE|nr:chorion peroxidase-like [Anopheles bellator]